MGFCDTLQKNRDNTVPISLPLQAMSVEEKLQVMEAIWDDLSRHVDELQPPLAQQSAVRLGGSHRAWRGNL